jgi:hypothetical protein
MKYLLPLILSVASLHAQDTKKIDKTELELLGASLGVRILDTYSTNRALERGAHELFLPDFISHHPPTMAAYGVSVVFVEYLGASYLTKHGHAKIAHVLTALDATQDGFWAMHNLTLKAEGKKGVKWNRMK